MSRNTLFRSLARVAPLLPDLKLLWLGSASNRRICEPRETFIIVSDTYLRVPVLEATNHAQKKKFNFIASRRGTTHKLLRNSFIKPPFRLVISFALKKGGRGQGRTKRRRKMWMYIESLLVCIIKFLVVPLVEFTILCTVIWLSSLSMEIIIESNSRITHSPWDVTEEINLIKLRKVTDHTIRHNRGATPTPWQKRWPTVVSQVWDRDPGPKRGVGDVPESTSDTGRHRSSYLVS